MNNIWFVGNPRLWWKDDLKNHPELVALDGSYIDGKLAKNLRKVYPYGELITSKTDKFTAKGFENKDIIITSKTSSALFPLSNVLNGEITENNFDHVADQFLSAEIGLDSVVCIDVTFKHIKHMITEYWMMPASGIATDPFVLRTTPNSWELRGWMEGKDDFTPGRWYTMDRRTNVTDWTALQLQDFIVKNPRYCDRVVLRIYKWYDCAIDDKKNGLKRFWIFGSEKHKFKLPELKSPDDNFVWVVPYNDLTLEDK